MPQEEIGLVACCVCATCGETGPEQDVDLDRPVEEAKKEFNALYEKAGWKRVELLAFCPKCRQ